MPQVVKKVLLEMANYHGWAYRELFKAIKPITNANYYQNRGLYFGSIHGTLNHLHLVDSLWLSRFKNVPFPITGLDQELYTEREELKEATLSRADEWSQWLTQVPPADLLGTLSYTNSKDQAQVKPYAGTLLHVFNHGTHHRGQITAAVTSITEKSNSPVLDLFMYPEMRKFDLFKSRIMLAKVNGENDPNGLTSSGYPKVHQAIYNGDYDIFCMLLSIGAKLTLSDCNGLKPIHIAVQTDRVNFICRLLLSGVFIDEKDDVKKRTPLHMAICKNASIDCIQFLIGIGASLAIKDINGFTALHHAVRKNRPEIVELLLQVGYYSIEDKNEVMNYAKTDSMRELLKNHNKEDNLALTRESLARKAYVRIKEERMMPTLQEKKSNSLEIAPSFSIGR